MSSLDRVELMVALEDTFQTRIDEGAFAGAQRSRPAARRSSSAPRPAPRRRPSRSTSRRGRAARSRARSAASTCRRGFCRWRACSRGLRVEGLEHLRDLEGPVIFASNHQSFMDGPVIMAALPPRWRYRVAPAMAKEMFAAHFFPEQHGRAGVVHQQPELLPRGAVLQRVSAAAARGGRAADAALHRRAARGRHSVLIFPEGRRSESGAIDAFRPGIGMIAVEARRAGRAGADRRPAARARRRPAHGAPRPRARRLRRAAAAGRRGLRSAGEDGRGGRPGALNGRSITTIRCVPHACGTMFV